MTRFVSIASLLFVVSTVAFAQKPTVQMYIQQVSKGWTTDAKQALPDLLLEKPDDPGVMYLHALLVDEPQKARPLYERIIQRHPNSEWTDDAMYHVILAECFANNATKAKEQFVEMRKLFPNSTLLPLAYDALRMSVGTPPPANASDKTDAPAKQDKPTTFPQHVYTLNTKIHSSKSDAVAMLELFKKKRMRARLAEKWVKGKRNYVVQVGEYDTEVAAAKDIELVRGICSCKPTVVKRD